MDNWAIFWICWFSYLAIKYTVNAFTYDKNKALKEIVKEESSKKIDDELEKFLGDFEITDSKDFFSKIKENKNT